MPRPPIHAATLLTFGLALSACATSEPALRAPPTYVVLAEPHEPLYRAVSVAEVTGGGRFGLDLSTKKTETMLADAGMLSPHKANARYLLDVAVLSVEGAADGRLAQSIARYELRDAVTGAVAFAADVDAAAEERGDLLRQSFGGFLEQASAAALVSTRVAVSCRALNGPVSGTTVLISTPDAVGIDCPRPPR